MVNKLLEWAGPELMDEPHVESNIMKYFLKLTPFDEVAIDVLCDSEPDTISDTAQITYFGHFPNGTTTKAVLHILQCIKRQQFARFDYGDVENMKKYGQKEPKKYKLSMIKDMPIALICGQ
jgi:hypothetical protein